MTKILAPLFVALQFLTILPVPRHNEISKTAVASSLYYYPLVGLMIGAILYAAVWLLAGLFSTAVVAALVLCLWVALTGALHLDGLADCADAWIGGLGSRERTLAIMKDPLSGPVAVALLLVLLLLKWALIEMVVAQQAAAWLLLAPMAGRMAAVMLLLTTAYVRPGGLGAAFTAVSPPIAWLVLLLPAVAALHLWPSVIAVMLMLSAVVYVGWRSMMVNWLGGCTGDTAGAMIELIEIAALLAIAAMVKGAVAL